MNLKSKTIAFLGDSITEGCGVADQANRYDNRMLRDAELASVHNYGIGGSRLAHQQKATWCPRFDLCFCGRAFNITQEADIIVVYGGVNDYLHGDALFGKPDDNTPATFCGGVRWLMSFLKDNFKEKTIVFMTPAHCNFGGNSDADPSPDQNKINPVAGKVDARPLVEYVDVILATGAELGIPVLDLYRNLGIDPNREEDKAAYTADGLHLNDAGHAILAKQLTAFLRAL